MVQLSGAVVYQLRVRQKVTLLCRWASLNPIVCRAPLNRLTLNVWVNGGVLVKAGCVTMCGTDVAI